MSDASRDAGEVAAYYALGLERDRLADEHRRAVLLAVPATPEAEPTLLGVSGPLGLLRHPLTPPHRGVYAS